MTDRFDIESAKKVLEEWPEPSLQIHKWRRQAFADTIAAYERLTTPTEHAGLVADLQHLMLYEDPRSEDYAILERAAAALQAVPPVSSDHAGLVKFWESYRSKLGEFGHLSQKIRETIAALQAPVPAEVERDVQAALGIWCDSIERRKIERLVQHVRTLSRTNEALTREHDARVAKVRAALEPFAEIGMWLFARSNVPDDEPVYQYARLNNAENGWLTRGHFKAAYTALAIIDAELPPASPRAKPVSMLVSPDWLREKIDTDPEIETEATPAGHGAEGEALSANRLQVRLDDAYQALRRIAEGNLGSGPGQDNYETIKIVARGALPEDMRDGRTHPADAESGGE